jgi:anaerobic selenocysteine-containing dehydrogenase
LLLTCAKPTLFLQSQNRALASLPERSMFPEVEIHPEAARERRISQGDWVSITTAHGGSVRACARFNETLDPRVVVGQHGWWQRCAELDAPGYDPCGPMGANYNLLIDPTVADPVGRTASYRANMCEIRAVEAS